MLAIFFGYNRYIAKHFGDDIITLSYSLLFALLSWIGIAFIFVISVFAAFVTLFCYLKEQYDEHDNILKTLNEWFTRTK